MCIRDRSNTVGDWRETRLRKLTSEYAPKDVFNSDEKGLFLNVFPDRTLAFKEDKCHGEKRGKQRVIVLLCVNSDRSDKLLPLTAGKFARPCFKNVETLPTKYANKSWMTTKVFEDWLQAVSYTHLMYICILQCRFCTNPSAIAIY